MHGAETRVSKHGGRASAHAPIAKRKQQASRDEDVWRSQPPAGIIGAPHKSRCKQQLCRGQATAADAAAITSKLAAAFVPGAAAAAAAAAAGGAAAAFASMVGAAAAAALSAAGGAAAAAALSARVGAAAALALAGLEAMRGACPCWGPGGEVAALQRRDDAVRCGGLMWVDLPPEPHFLIRGLRMQVHAMVLRGLKGHTRRVKGHARQGTANK